MKLSDYEEDLLHEFLMSLDSCRQYCYKNNVLSFLNEAGKMQGLKYALSMSFVELDEATKKEYLKYINYKHRLLELENCITKNKDKTKRKKKAAE